MEPEVKNVAWKGIGLYPQSGEDSLPQLKGRKLSAVQRNLTRRPKECTLWNPWPFGSPIRVPRTFHPIPLNGVGSKVPRSFQMVKGRKVQGQPQVKPKPLETGPIVKPQVPIKFGSQPSQKCCVCCFSDETPLIGQGSRLPCLSFVFLRLTPLFLVLGCSSFPTHLSFFNNSMKKTLLMRCVSLQQTSCCELH